MKKNYIDKVFVEVDVASSGSLSGVKDSVDVLIKNKILPVIEEIIEEYVTKVPEHKVLQINKLSLEIGALQQLSDRFDLKEVLTAGFYKALSEDNDDVNPIIREIGIRPENTNEHIAETNQKIINKESRWLHSLILFLESGELPWWISDPNDLKALMEPEKLKALIVPGSNYFANELSRIIREPRVRKRLIAQFPDSVNFLWSGLLINENVNNSLSTGFKNTLTKDRIARTVFWEAVWEALAEGKRGSASLSRATEIRLLKTLATQSASNFNKQFLAEFTVFTDEMYRSYSKGAPFSTEHFMDSKALFLYLKRLEEVVAEPRQYTDLIPPEWIGFREKLSQFLNEENLFFNIDNNENKKLEFDGLVVPEPDEELLMRELLPEKPVSEKQWEEERGEEGGVYTAHAGLVLLHPFMKHYFEKLGLLKEKKQLINRQLSAQVYYYLATGEWNGWEFSMTMEKYLAGIPEEEPLERFLEAPANLEEETRNLFDAVRENWTSMETSSDALIRAEFIQRSGKLIFKDGMHKLIVEKKTQDILLSRLGWTIGMFKMPWMNQLLYVEW